jgi:hypothetical protein
MGRMPKSPLEILEGFLHFSELPALLPPAQEILDIMHPGRETGDGIDLIWECCESDIPGAAVSNALCKGENIYRHCLSVIEAREAARTPKR